MKVTAALEFWVPDNINTDALAAQLDFIAATMRGRPPIPGTYPRLDDANIPWFRLNDGETTWRADRKPLVTP